MSDQDFFFDDEDEGAKSAAKSDSRPAKSGPSPRPGGQRPGAPSAGDSFLERETTMTVAALIGVIGLLLGVIVGYVLAGVLTSPTVNVPAAAVGTPGQAGGMGTGGGTPGPLTNEQLNAGQLPAGHPSINQGAGQATTATK